MSRRLNVVEFRKLYDQGETDAQIAQELGFCARTICAARCKLGLPSHVVRSNLWQDDDLATLRRLAADGRTVKQIADALGCDPKRVSWKARQEGIKLALLVRPFSAEDDEEILRSLGARNTYRAVAARLGRSVKAVSQRRAVLVERRKLAMAVAAEKSREAQIARAAVPLKVCAPRDRSEEARRDELGRLAARCGADLVNDLAKIQTKKTYDKLDAVAQRHGLPFQRVQSLWHQVRAV